MLMENRREAAIYFCILSLLNNRPGEKNENKVNTGFALVFWQYSRQVYDAFAFESMRFRASHERAQTCWIIIVFPWFEIRFTGHSWLCCEHSFHLFCAASKSCCHGGCSVRYTFAFHCDFSSSEFLMISQCRKPSIGSALSYVIPVLLFTKQAQAQARCISLPTLTPCVHTE